MPEITHEDIENINNVTKELGQPYRRKYRQKEHYEDNQENLDDKENENPNK